MSWTMPADLRIQVQRLWDRGDLQRATVTDTVSWPLRLTLRAPTAADLSDRFEAVRDWVRAVADTPRVRIEWREWNHRVQGMQRLPAAVWIDTLQNALAFIGKGREAQKFEALWQQTAATQPALLAWLARRPIQALDMADRWERLLAVVTWLQVHPRPALYLRQVDAPGKPELTFSTSVERTQDIQPVVIRVTLGQGEPPVSAAERDRSYKKDKVWAGVFGLLAVLGFWWWRRQRVA